MIDSIVKGISRIFGNKSDRDLKSILPRIQKINAHYESYATLSNDQLRAKTAEFKQRIADYLSDTEAEIKKVKERLANEPDMDLDEKQSLYTSLDKLKKERNENLEKA